MPDLRPAANRTRGLPHRGWAARLTGTALVMLLVSVLAACGGQPVELNWSGRVQVTTAAYRVPGGPAAPTGTAVLTQRDSSSRVGWNGDETVLNDHNVNAAGFGEVLAYPVDGKIYSQPLFVPRLRVDGRVHNVVIVTTERDSVYAFDADA